MYRLIIVLKVLEHHWDLIVWLIYLLNPFMRCSDRKLSLPWRWTFCRLLDIDLLTKWISTEVTGLAFASSPWILMTTRRNTTKLVLLEAYSAATCIVSTALDASSQRIHWNSIIIAFILDPKVDIFLMWFGLLRIHLYFKMYIIKSRIFKDNFRF